MNETFLALNINLCYIKDRVQLKTYFDFEPTQHRVAEQQIFWLFQTTFKTKYEILLMFWV